MPTKLASMGAVLYEAGLKQDKLVLCLALQDAELDKWVSGGDKKKASNKGSSRPLRQACTMCKQLVVGLRWPLSLSTLQDWWMVMSI